MLHYERFQETVLAEGGTAAHEWKHLLPAIPVAHRLRFLHTMRKGFSVPASFDMIMLSMTLGDRDYDLFVQQAVATKLTGDANTESGTIEKFTMND